CPNRPLGNNLYTLSLQDMMASSPICILSKASKTKSWLWHRRLSHLNFRAIKHLARQGLVRGLLKLKFEKDHLCSACAMGKSTKKTHKSKSEDTNQEKLYLLHMDLCGPMRVESVNGKKYIIVIVDDYSRFTWSDVSEQTMELSLLIKLCVITMKRLASLKKHQLHALHNRIKAMATACFAQNRSIIRLRHGKTPYELLHSKLPDLSFFHVFGALCYLTNDSENLVIPQDVGDDNLDMEVAHMGNDPLLGVPIPEVTSTQYSSTASPQSIVQPNHLMTHHNSKWMKDHPLNNIIGQLSRPVKLNELGGILKNKARLVARGYRQEEGFNFEESFAPDSSVALTAFADADHAGCQDTPRSTFGRTGLVSSLRTDLDGFSGTDLVSSLRTDLDGSSGTDLDSSLRTDLDGSFGTDLVSSLRTDLDGSLGTDLVCSQTTNLVRTLGFLMSKFTSFIYMNVFVVQMSLPIIMKNAWTTATTIEQQVALDEALVPSTKSKKNIVNLETFRDMLHISPRVPGQSFDELPFEEKILDFLQFLGHSAQIKTLTDVISSANLVGALSQKKHRLCISDMGRFCVSSGTQESKEEQRDVLPKIHKIHHPSLHDEEIFNSKTKQELKNDEIRNFKSYKEYYACTTREAAPKPKASARRKMSDSDTSITPHTAISTPITTVAAAPRLTATAKRKQPAKSKKTREEEEESFDPIPRTPEDSEDDGNGEEDQGLRVSAEQRLIEEEADELYRDVDINQGRGLHLSQDIEDSHVTLTLVHPDGQQENSSVSSFVTRMLNPISDAGVESIFTTASSSVAPLPTPIPTMTPSIITTIKTASHPPIPPTPIPNEQRNLYKALIDAYEADKTILDSYGEIAILKRRREDDDDKEGPSAGSDRGSKRRREGGEPKSARAPLEPATRSADRSTIGSKSRQASASESAFAEEPVHTISQIEEPSHPVFEIGAGDQHIVQTSQHPEWFPLPKKPPTPDRDWNKTLPAIQGSAQTWISELAK
nr:Gag-Pol polyprotein [Tanacetum cinerariifolium]